MRHYHRTEDEKRMVVILAEEEYDGWLEGRAGDAQFTRQDLADLQPVI